MSTINWSSPSPLVIKGTTTNIQSSNAPSATGLDENLLIAYVGNDGKLYTTEFDILDSSCSPPVNVPNSVTPVNVPLSLGLRGVFTNNRNQIALVYAASNQHPTMQFLEILDGTWSNPLDLTSLSPNPAPSFAFHPALADLGEWLHIIAPGTSDAPRTVFDCPYDLVQDEMESQITTNISQQVFRGYGCETLDDSKILMVLAGVSSDESGANYYYSVFDSIAGSWSAAKQMGSGFDSWQTPSLQSIGNGKAVLLYANTGYGVTYSIYDSSNDSWTSPTIISVVSAGTAPGLTAAGDKLYAFLPIGNDHTYNVISAPIPS